MILDISCSKFVDLQPVVAVAVVVAEDEIAAHILTIAASAD